MNKITIKVTLSSATAPALFTRLTSIVDARERAIVLRQLAELACAHVANVPYPLLPVASSHAAHSERDRDDLRSRLNDAGHLSREARDSPVHEAAAAPLPSNLSGQSSANAMSATMAEHLAAATAKFFL